jgi:hypothetical protein
MAGNEIFLQQIFRFHLTSPKGKVLGRQFPVQVMEPKKPRTNGRAIPGMA